jgi:hypothetical protein
MVTSFHHFSHDLQREKAIHEGSGECNFFRMKIRDDAFVRCLLRLCYFGSKGSNYSSFSVIPISLFDQIKNSTENSQKIEKDGIVVDRWEDVLSLETGSNSDQMFELTLPNKIKTVLKPVLPFLIVRSYNVFQIKNTVKNNLRSC